IKDSVFPSMVKHLAESFRAWRCYGSLDLFITFDQWTLNQWSQDMTLFQMPLGSLCLTSIPMGCTNPMQIMHGDVMHIL
ncbi:uncharacterized protein LAESUDRAFT_656197, partial [Laetiporus sulphureus 93-53]